MVNRQNSAFFVVFIDIILAFYVSIGYNYIIAIKGGDPKPHL